MSQKPKVSCNSDKFSINFYTDSPLSWHGKLVICRTCSVYVIYNKTHCLNSSSKSISVSSDLGLHSDSLCGFALQFSISLILFSFFPLKFGSFSFRYH